RYVYVAVNERINDIWVPRIYGPGNIPSEMTDGRKDSGIEAMGMDENRNLYAVGWQENSKRTMFAVYWKNCSVVMLTDSTQNVFGIATGITTSGDDVYISGYMAKNGHTNAVYWKNEELIELTSGENDAHTADIFVHGEDVYVTGSEKNSNNVYEARLWKNGVMQKMNGHYTASVYANEGYVYVTGDFGPGKYWHNGAYKSLGNVEGDGTAHVQVHNNSVYMTTSGKYWKDGVSVDLKANLFSLAVFKDDVYLGGSQFENSKGTYVARYWKNGKAVDLTDGTNNAHAGDIVVVSTE
ncbi:MAG TPA: hypothetical protein VGK59_04670, partial [Ohtaekwangia sp.]